jgi:hypothetical protein
MSVYYRYLGVHRNRDGVEGPFEFASDKRLDDDSARREVIARCFGPWLGGPGSPEGAVIVRIRRFKVNVRDES